MFEIDVNSIRPKNLQEMICQLKDVDGNALLDELMININGFKTFYNAVSFILY